MSSVYVTQRGVDGDESTKMDSEMAVSESEAADSESKMAVSCFERIETTVSDARNGQIGFQTAVLDTKTNGYENVRFFIQTAKFQTSEQSR